MIKCAVDILPAGFGAPERSVHPAREFRRRHFFLKSQARVQQAVRLEKTMIELTKLNETVIMINEDYIEVIEETPDTVITMTTGRKLIVKESRQEIKNLVKSYKREIGEQG